MFRTDLLPLIRSLNTVYTEKGICHKGYVDCLLATSLADSQHTSMTKTTGVNAISRLLMMDSKSVRNI
jgi:uncharacterized metal-binding protein